MSISPNASRSSALVVTSDARLSPDRERAARQYPESAARGAIRAQPKSSPLIDVERAEPRVLVDDAAQREAVGCGHDREKRRSRGFRSCPRLVAPETAGMQGRRRLPPLGAIGEHRLDIRRQQRRIILFDRKTLGTRVRNLATDDRGESLIDKREVFEDAGNRPAIGGRTRSRCSVGTRSTVSRRFARELASRANISLRAGCMTRS